MFSPVVLTWSLLIQSLFKGYTQGHYDYEQYGQDQYAPYDASYQQPAHNQSQPAETTNKPVNDNQEVEDVSKNTPSMLTFE